MANEYVTATALKVTLALAGTTFADDDIGLAVESASRDVDAICGRRFYTDADAAQVRYYTPISPAVVHTDDIVTLTSLEVDRGGDGTFDETWTEDTDFTLEPLNAGADGWPRWIVRVHPRGSYTFPRLPRSVKVTGKFGWAAVPPAVEQATGLLASRLLTRARMAPLGIVQIGVDGGAGRVPRVDPDVTALLAPFIRNPGVV